MWIQCPSCERQFRIKNVGHAAQARCTCGTMIPLAALGDEHSSSSATEDQAAVTIALGGRAQAASTKGESQSGATTGAVGDDTPASVGLADERELWESLDRRVDGMKAVQRAVIGLVALILFIWAAVEAGAGATSRMVMFGWPIYTLAAVWIAIGNTVGLVKCAGTSKRIPGYYPPIVAAVLQVAGFILPLVLYQIGVLDRIMPMLLDGWVGIMAVTTLASSVALLITFFATCRIIGRRDLGWMFLGDVVLFAVPIVAILAEAIADRNAIGRISIRDYRLWLWLCLIVLALVGFAILLHKLMRATDQYLIRQRHRAQDAAAAVHRAT